VGGGRPGPAARRRAALGRLPPEPPQRNDQPDDAPRGDARQAAPLEPRRRDGRVEIVRATPDKEREADFIMLRDGLICFEGDADALRRSSDPYIQTFLS